jgi:hypothetical protein
MSSTHHLPSKTLQSLALVLTLVLGAACTEAPPVSSRGTRYCEILLIYFRNSEVIAEVWGTQGISNCPAASWNALDPDSIVAEHNAIAIKMNGPRYGLVDTAPRFELPSSERRMYGDLEMKRLATLVLDGALSTDPYTPRTVRRDNVFEYWEGSEIYELTEPDGGVYTMISYSQIVDPSLQESALPQLAGRLSLPAGWSFAARTLDEVLQLRSDGQTVVLQDELENTYQGR